MTDRPNNLYAKDNHYQKFPPSICITAEKLMFPPIALGRQFSLLKPLRPGGYIIKFIKTYGKGL